MKHYPDLLPCLYLAQQPPLGQGLLIHEVSRLNTQRRTTVGRTPLDEWSAGRRDLYLTTHNTHNRQTSMPSEGFEPTISAGELLQIYTLDRAATRTGRQWLIRVVYNHRISNNNNNNMHILGFSSALFLVPFTFRRQCKSSGGHLTYSWRPNCNTHSM